MNTIRLIKHIVLLFVSTSYSVLPLSHQGWMTKCKIGYFLELFNLSAIFIFLYCIDIITILARDNFINVHHKSFVNLTIIISKRDSSDEKAGGCRSKGPRFRPCRDPEIHFNIYRVFIRIYMADNHGIMGISPWTSAGMIEILHSPRGGVIKGNG